jgi:hypothetical protein
MTRKVIKEVDGQRRIIRVGGLKGDQGDPGAAGQPVYTYVGDWDPGTAYAFTEAVSHEGVLYYATGAIAAGVEPDHTVSGNPWATLGPPGPKGDKGDDGADGTGGGTAQFPPGADEREVLFTVLGGEVVWAHPAVTGLGLFYTHRAASDGVYPPLPSWVPQAVDGAGNALTLVLWIGPADPQGQTGHLPGHLWLNTSGTP